MNFEVKDYLIFYALKN